jgi:glycosyltransferase involved in cell wall biosynthesis
MTQENIIQKRLTLHLKKIALVGNASSIHLIKIANELDRRGYEVVLFSLHPSGTLLGKNVKYIRLPGNLPTAYLAAALALRKELKAFGPDIINCHYASGYGVLTSITPKTAPVLMSVWGSDVYDFPRKNAFCRLALKGVFHRSNAIASTSHCMADEAKLYSMRKKILLTPFGVDIDLFSDSNLIKSRRIPLTFGTIKSLHRNYGIDVLIRSFNDLITRYPETRSCRLVIIGNGEARDELVELTKDLNLINQVQFHDAVPNSRVPEKLHEIDVFVALSRHESFGVAVLEAAACARAIIVSDAPGLSEVMIADETALIVPRDNVARSADAMHRLFESAELRLRLGERARAHVVEKFNSQVCFDRLINAYRDTLANGT